MFEHFDPEELIGIDSSPDLQGIAQELGRKTFRCGYLENIEEHVQGTFPLIIGRNVSLNPNHDGREGPDPWPAIFEKLTRYIADNGQLFLTLAEEHEPERARQILKQTGYTIQRDEQNPIAIPCDNLFGVSGNGTKDNYVIIASPP